MTGHDKRLRFWKAWLRLHGVRRLSERAAQLIRQHIDSDKATATDPAVRHVGRIIG